MANAGSCFASSTGGRILDLKFTEPVTNGPSVSTETTLGFGSDALGAEVEYNFTRWIHISASLDEERSLRSQPPLLANNTAPFQWEYASLRGTWGLGIHF